MYDITIIGAGVVGAMIARELSKYDLAICLVEKESDVAMGSTKANSAIIHAGYDAECGSLKAQLNVKGSQMMQRVTNDLGVKYKRNGSLVIGFNEEDMKAIEKLYTRGVNNGVKDLQVINKNKLKELEPNIKDKAIGALYAPSGAIVCPYELTIAAIGNAMDNGVALKLNFMVDNIKYSNGYYEVISNNNKVIKTKYIINAAGLFADRIASMVGYNSFKIKPRKWEYLLLDKDCGSLIIHTIFRVPSEMGKGILVTPTVDENLLIGPTSENIDDKQDNSTTSIGINKVIKEALENVPVIPMKSIISSFCGLRASTDKGDFIINSPKSNFINAAGIESPGLSAAPAIAVYVLELLKQNGVDLIKKENFNPYRESMYKFRNMTLEEKNEIIFKDKKYGRIICRCEGISEGEIVKAIHTTPKAYNLDAVKRRTRSGMGRCQGGFCTPFIVDILSRELNISAHEITKSSVASKIIIGRTK